MKIGKYNFTEGQFMKVFVLCFVVLPLLLVHLLKIYETHIRLYFVIQVVVILPIIFLSLSLNRRYIFRKKNGEAYSKKTQIFTRILGLLLGVFCIIYLTIPTLSALGSYLAGNSLVKKIDSPINFQAPANGSFLIGWTFNLASDTNTNDSYWYLYPVWYPWHIQFGHNYEFTILPNSKIILKVEPIE